MHAIIVARQVLELGAHPEMMLLVGLVHRLHQPRHPADAGLDGGEAQGREALEHARGAEVRHRLDGRRQRVRNVVHDRAAVAARGARIAAGRDMEGDRQVGVGDRRPQRIEMRQVVVHVVAVMRAPHRLARQGQALEAEPGQPMHLGDRAFEVCGRERAGRDHAVLVGAELLPCPVVPHPALRHGELRVGRRPHGEALVGEDQLDIDAVEIVVGQATERVSTRLVARLVLSFEGREPQPVRPVAFSDSPTARRPCL